MYSSEPAACFTSWFGHVLGRARWSPAEATGVGCHSTSRFRRNAFATKNYFPFADRTGSFNDCILFSDVSILGTSVVGPDAQPWMLRSAVSCVCI